MTTERILDASKTINGSFGKVTYNSVNLLNIMSIEARLTVAKKDIRVSGTRRTKYKAMDVRGEGNFTIYKVNSEFTKHMADIFSDRSQESLGLISSGTALSIAIRDPEIDGDQVENSLLHDVKIWEVPIGFSVDELIDQNMQFTFEDISVDETIDSEFDLDL